MIKLHYITNGDMNIELENMTFGKHEKDPVDNVKSFICKNKQISLIEKIWEILQIGELLNLNLMEKIHL